MKAWKIFRHALRQVTGNLKSALFISAIPLAAVAVFATLMIGNVLFLSQAELDQRVGSGHAIGDFGRLFVVFIAFGLVFLWTAVAWHRFVLLNEQTGLLPRFHGSRIAAYFGKGLLLAMLLLIPLLLFQVLVTLIAVNLPPSAVAYTLYLLIPIVLLISAFALRLGTILPGAALGVPTSFKSGLAATRGNGLTFYGLVAILWLLGMVCNFVTSILATASKVLALAWYLPSQWFLTMLSLSVLTTLYGYYIEKRPLVDGSRHTPAA